MLEIVEPDLLFPAADTNSYRVFQDCKEGATCDGGPGCDGQYTNGLACQHTGTTAIEESWQGRIGRKESNHQGPEGTTYAMHRDGTHGIIHLQFPVYELYEKTTSIPAISPMRTAPPGVTTSTGGDGDQSRQHTIEGHAEGGFSVADPGR